MTTSDMTSRRALVTGAAGQDGRLLCQLLVSKGYEVWGLTRQADARSAELAAQALGVHVLHGDMLEQQVVSKVLAEANPQEVYNLAAFSSVGRSWSHIAEVMQVNTTVVVHLLEEIRRRQDITGTQIRFYQASSSEMFGAAAVSPQTEATAFHPRSPYGVSKAAAHYLTVNYRESYGMFCCSGILYNHESPLRDPQFVTRKISMGVAAISQGRSESIRLGTLDVHRDWGWAPDYVRAMWLMLQQPEAEDYVIATGTGRSLTDFLSEAFACVGVEDWGRHVVLDPQFQRPAEVRGLVGDATSARTRLGWRPTVDFPELVSRMVQHDLAAPS